ncbi:unnamed protein product [Caenorhabditis sp. 36 PRJEB53466]|nr:unnamed protein product [Caenorhabditis sp. 36 PRJEB53466]
MDGEIVLDGVTMAWPFIYAADTIRVVDFHLGDKFQSICLLTHRDKIAAFLQIKKMKKNNDEDGNEIEAISWLPLRWEPLKVHELFVGMIPSLPNVGLTDTFKNMQDFFRSMQQTANGGYSSEPVQWIA